MIDDQREDIYEELNVKETEDLLEIWQFGDIEAWDEIDFEIIKEILSGRLGYVPAQSIELQISEILYRIEDDLENNELEKALSDCERALQLKPDFVIPYNYLGEIYDEMGQFEKAIFHYQKAIELAPSFEDAWENMREVETILEEKFEESLAKKHLDQALENAHNGETNKAVEECEKAETILPAIARAYHDLGLVYETLGLLEPAMNAYRKAIQLNSEFKAAWKNLLRIDKVFKKEFKTSAVKQHLDQALEYANAGELEKALAECEMAKPFMPPLALAYNYLGLIFHTLEQLEPAIDAYLKAIQFNPRFYAARENLATARLAWEEEQYRLFTNRSLEEVQDIEFDESQMLVTSEPIPQWFYLDENAFLLPGWAGHRTRQGRSGYDPLEYEFEAAHIQGTIIRALLVGKFRTRNPVYLGLMVFVGSLYFLVGIMPFVFWNFGSILFGITVIPYLIVGALLLVNVYRSLRLGKSVEEDEKGYIFF